MGDYNRLVVEFDERDICSLKEYKKLCLFIYGSGGITKRTVEIIKEDLKRLKKDNKIDIK